ncbi:MAG: NDP-sugar synthase [Pseudomonadota bacterium]
MISLERPLEGTDVFVLAAGLGERLRPLSLERPKCLFPVMNRPLLEVCLEWLAGLGAARAVVNVHYLWGQVETWLATAKLPLEVDLSVEEDILGTGGGIRRASGRFQRTFAVVNADCVLRGIDIAGALETHRRQGGLATLLLQQDGSARNVTVEHDLVTSLRGRPEKAAGTPLGFTGFQLVEPAVAREIPNGFSDIIDVYLACLARGARLGGHLSRGHYFRDIGTPASYLALHRDVFAGLLSVPGVETPGGVCLAEGVLIEDGALVGPGVSAGAGSCFRAGCRVRDCVIWEGVEIAAGVDLRDCLGAGGRATSQTPAPGGRATSQTPAPAIFVAT